MAKLSKEKGCSDIFNCGWWRGRLQFILSRKRATNKEKFWGTNDEL